MSKINVLGTDYDVLVKSEKENPKLKEANGLCEVYAQKIYIIDQNDRKDNATYENVDEYYHKVLRHELFHAIFAEAGLTDYLEDETLVEALAVLYPKIQKIMEQAESFDFIQGGNKDGKGKNKTSKRQRRASKVGNDKG